LSHANLIKLSEFKDIHYSLSLYERDKSLTIFHKLFKKRQ